MKMSLLFALTCPLIFFLTSPVNLDEFFEIITRSQQNSTKYIRYSYYGSNATEGISIQRQLLIKLKVYIGQPSNISSEIFFNRLVCVDEINFLKSSVSFFVSSSEPVFDICKQIKTLSW